MILGYTAVSDCIIDSHLHQSPQITCLINCYIKCTQNGVCIKRETCFAGWIFLANLVCCYQEIIHDVFKHANQ
jgi:hypothetical protein